MNSKTKQFKTLLLLASFLLVGLIVLHGCKKSEPEASQTSAEKMQEMEEHEGHEHEAMMAKPAKEAVTAAIEQTTCPVMKMKMKIDKNIFVEYQGKKVYFCCLRCKPEFEKNPEKYVGMLPQFKN